MSDSIRDDIARLEERIESLALSIERCRKISLGAKTFISAGTIGIILTLWVIPFNPALFFAALAAMIGGAVLLGSNKTTWEQMVVGLREAEALRIELIGRVDMRVVVENRNTMH
jgi:hypothetical protein